MIFGKKKTQREIDLAESTYNAYAPISDDFEIPEPEDGITPTIIRHEVVTYCEDMLNLSKEIEDAKAEYNMVTAFINDILIIDQLSPEEMEPIIVTAEKIIQLNKAREEYLNADVELTESQYDQIQREEEKIQDVVQRLEANEENLATIKKDLHYLEGEKVEWEIVRKECQQSQKLLRLMAVLLMSVFAIAMIALFYVGYSMDLPIRIPVLVTILVSALMGSYILFKYQDCSKEIKRCAANQNRAITLENHIKIKYVNMKNAVDYTCDKYNVSNSKQLIYAYEQYQAAERKQKQFQKTNDDLVYFEGVLAKRLEAHWLRDPQGWTNYVKALTDKKEMALLRNDLLARRKKLKYRLDYNLDTIKEMKKNIERNMDELGNLRPQIERIMASIDEITLSPLQ